MAKSPIPSTLALAVLAVITCGRDTTGPRDVGIKTVTVSPQSDSLLVGDTLRFQVTVVDSAFHQVLNPTVTWRSTDTTAVAIDPTGLAIARRAGTVAISAIVEGDTGGAFLTAQWPVVAVQMPDSLTITRYEVIRFLPGLETPTGTEVSDRAVVWTSSNTLVAGVSPSGVVTPAGLGITFVKAASSGSQDSTRLTIVSEPARHVGLTQALPLPLQAGQPQPVAGFCTDSLQRDVAGDSLTWTSTDTSLLTVAGHDRNATVMPLRPGSPVLRVSCGGLTDTVVVPVFLPVTSLRFSPETVTVAVGQVMTPETVFRDSSGGLHGYGQVTLQSLDTTVAAVKFATALIGVKPGVARLIGTAVSAPYSDSLTVRVVPTENLRVSLAWFNYPGDLPNYSRTVGIAILRDTAGSPPVSPHVVKLKSSDTSVARISPDSLTVQDTGTIVLAFGRAGLAVITAQVDSLSTTQTVLSDNVPVAKVSFATRPPRVMQVGDTAPLIANVFGTDFSARFYPVTWTASNPSRAQLDPEGISLAQTGMVARMTALATGQVTIRASSGGHTDTAVVTIRSASAPVIASAGPLPLTPGTVAILNGSGYDPNPVNDSVWIDGVLVPVTGATSTSLTLALPDRSAFRCTPTHQAIIAVGVGGVLAVDSLPLQVGYSITPDPNGTGRAPAGTTCVELTTVSGQVVWIAIANPSASPDALASFQVNGSASWASTPVPVKRPASVIATPLSGSTAQGFRLDSLVTAALAHRRHLENESALMRRLGSPAQQWAAVRASGSSGPARSIGTRLGDTVLFHVPHVDRPDLCSSYDAIEARRVYTGTHAQIFEDISSPVAGQMDSVFAAVGREYDTLDYPVLLANFGDPLVLDQLLSRVGKITMVFSPSVNQAGVLGFVTGCDFYPESVAPSSNVTEVFYGPVPTSPGTGFGSFTPDVWKWEIRSALIHESKHITSFAAHLAQHAPPEETWLEEGSAVLAEELWSRTFYGTQWKGNAGYSQTLYCDVRPTFPACSGRPYSMFNAFSFLYAYARASESRSPLGPTASNDASFYGSGWSLLRWAIDQYAGSESQFIRALVQEPALTGVANLEARTGQSFTRMSADWQLTLRSDGLGGFTSADPTVTLPSWDLRNIYAGMNQDFPSDFPTDFPEQTRDESMAGFGPGTFNETVTGLPGGTSVVLFPTNAGQGGITLHLQGPTGGAPPFLQVEVLRIQ